MLTALYGEKTMSTSLYYCIDFDDMIFSVPKPGDFDNYDLKKHDQEDDEEDDFDEENPPGEGDC